MGACHSSKPLFQKPNSGSGAKTSAASKPSQPSTSAKHGFRFKSAFRSSKSSSQPPDGGANPSAAAEPSEVSTSKPKSKLEDLGIKVLATGTEPIVEYAILVLHVPAISNRAGTVSSPSTAWTATGRRHGRLKMAHCGFVTCYPPIYQMPESSPTGMMQTLAAANASQHKQYFDTPRISCKSSQGAVRARLE